MGAGAIEAMVAALADGSSNEFKDISILQLMTVLNVDSGACVCAWSWRARRSAARCLVAAWASWADIGSFLAVLCIG